jgi:plastocyanin
MNSSKRGSSPMNKGIAVLVACCGFSLAAGCGSSSKSSGTPTPTSATTAPTGTTAPTATSSLKASTKPKYGTPSASQPVQSGTVQIAYRNIAINPDTVRVRVGSTIRWTNHDPVEHNVTSEGGPQKFASKTFAEGASFAITASRPGLIHYLCTIHPASMNGTIEVVK